MVSFLRLSLFEEMKSTLADVLHQLRWLLVKEEPLPDDALCWLWWRFVCVSTRIMMYIGVLPSVVTPCKLIILWCMTMIATVIWQCDGLLSWTITLLFISMDFPSWKIGIITIGIRATLDPRMRPLGPNTRLEAKHLIYCRTIGANTCLIPCLEFYR
jgi:hypothetical protein